MPLVCEVTDEAVAFPVPKKIAHRHSEANPFRGGVL
jgi:hypothetical protein